MTESTHTNFSETEKRERKLSWNWGISVLYGRCLGKGGASALWTVNKIIFNKWGKKS